jgi:hypothetical protein
VTDCGLEATRFDAKSSSGRIRSATIFAMNALPPRPRRRPSLAAGLGLVATGLVLPGCAVVTIAGTAASAAVTVGGAAVSVGSAVVGSTVRVAGKLVEKTIDVAAPAGAPPVK